MCGILERKRLLWRTLESGEKDIKLSSEKKVILMLIRHLLILKLLGNLQEILKAKWIEMSLKIIPWQVGHH